VIVAQRVRQLFVFWCYTEAVLKNVTITVSEDVARWARKKAPEENTSDWRAYRQVKRIRSIPGIDAANRLTREQAHARRP